MQYFEKYQTEMSDARKRRNSARLQSDLIRTNLMEELLTRMQVFEMLAIQQSIDNAVRIELANGRMLPEKYQYIITVDEDLRQISTQYKPL